MAEKTKKEETEEEVRKYASLEAVANSQGGQLLIKNLEKDFMAVIHTLRSKYATAELKELLPLLAKMDVRLDLIEVLRGAGKRKKDETETLKEILAEEAKHLEETQ